MPITAHAYRHPHDFARLVRFLSQVRTDVQHTHYLHVGDLTWQMFHMLSDYPPADLVQIWEDTHGDILGFVLLFPPFGGFEAHLRPQDRGTALEVELLGWAEQHLPARPRHSTLVNNRDTTRLTLLTDLGYVPQGEWLYVEQRPNNHMGLMPLSGPKIAPILADGSTRTSSRSIGAAQLRAKPFGPFVSSMLVLKEFIDALPYTD